jgi:hypothetical protein
MMMRKPDPVPMKTIVKTAVRREAPVYRVAALIIVAWVIVQAGVQWLS